MSWKEERRRLADTEVQLFRAGSGKPLLIPHDELGHPPAWLRVHDLLAKRNELVAPLAPGFGESAKVDWIMGMHDLARWYLHALDDLAAGPVDVIGYSLGGWLAAEMAAMDPSLFKKVVLVSPLGIKPPTGEIADMFVIGAAEYLTRGLSDPAKVPEYRQVCPDPAPPAVAEYWERAREQACLVGWKPYMHDPALPHILGRLKSVPTLIVWGSRDPIIPAQTAETFRSAIPGSRVELLDCGHHPALEKPEALAKLIHELV